MSSDTPSNSTWVAISAEELAQLHHDLAAMTARAEAAERDAERWRWFKANCGWEWHGPDSWKWYTLVPFSPQKDGDAAIDAAIAAAIREAVKP